MREAVEVVGHRDLRGDRSDRAGGDRVDGGLLRGVVEPQLVHPFAELHRPTARSEHPARRTPSGLSTPIPVITMREGPPLISGRKPDSPRKDCKSGYGRVIASPVMRASALLAVLLGFAAAAAAQQTPSVDDVAKRA